METFRKLEEEISQYCKDNSISPEEHPEIVAAAQHFYNAALDLIKEKASSNMHNAKLEKFHTGVDAGLHSVVDYIDMLRKSKEEYSILI